MTKGFKEIEIERLLGSAFENAAIGMAFNRLDGRWLRVNRALCQMLGYTAQELLEKTLQEITVQGDLDVDAAAQQNLLSGSVQNLSIEKRYIHKQGNVIWIHVRVSLLRDSEDKPELYFSQIEEITERKLSEAALRNSHDMFFTFLETMPQITWVAEPDGSSSYLNKQWTQYTGMAAGRVNDGKWLESFHPDDQAPTMAAWQKSLEKGKDFLVEARLRKHDGTYEWWLIRGISLRNSHGEITKWVGTCANVHELKSALNLSKVREELISAQAALISQTRDAILSLDMTGKILIWNQGAESLYGWSAKEAVGQKDIDLYAKDEQARSEIFQKVLFNGYWEGEMSQRRRNGANILVESRMTLIRNLLGGLQSITVIGTDVTDRKKNESNLLRAQRLESIGTLAGGIAHDLNNVFTPIMMAIEVLKDGVKDQIKLEMLETIASCSRRGANMIRQLLSFARGVEVDYFQLHPKDLIQGVANLIENTFPKQIQIKLKVPNKLWTVSGDSTQIHQVLLNLCVNSRDSMKTKGTLTLSAENVLLDENNALSKNGVARGPYVQIGIEDTGAGMSKETLARIFEPFFTTKEFGHGTGLGLSTSIGIIKSHHGCIQVYSEEGVGTKFSIYLPAEKVQEETPLLSESCDLIRGQGECILVVDDEESVRSMTCRTLETFGYRVRVASSGAEAISIYTKFNDDIRLVLTDVMMPDLNGFALILELRKINPQIRAIAASGLAKDAEDLSSNVFLSKPYSAETLLKTIRLALNNEMQTS